MDLKLYADYGKKTGGVNVGEKIISIFVCLLCAISFYVIAIYGKNSQTPMAFTSLKEKIVNVKRYNMEMFKLNMFYASVFVLTAGAFVLYQALGIFLLVFDCTVGLLMIYVKYRMILKKYTEGE